MPRPDGELLSSGTRVFRLTWPCSTLKGSLESQVSPISAPLTCRSLAVSGGGGGAFLTDCSGFSCLWAGVEGTCQLIFVGAPLPSRWLLGTEVETGRHKVIWSSGGSHTHFVPTKFVAQAVPEAAASLYSVIRTGNPPSMIPQALIRCQPTVTSKIQRSRRRYSRLSW